MRIRPLEQSDVDEVLALWRALVDTGTTADPRFVMADGGALAMRRHIVEVWTRSAPFPHALVASNNTGPLGFISGHPLPDQPVIALPATARIADLYVVPHARGEGVGGSLVDTFIAEAKRAGYDRIEVGTLTADLRAMAFWQRVGFGHWQTVFSRAT